MSLHTTEQVVCRVQHWVGIDRMLTRGQGPQKRTFLHFSRKTPVCGGGGGEGTSWTLETASMLSGCSFDVVHALGEEELESLVVLES